MRTSLLAACLLLLAGCNNTPKYQGDVVMGGFDFHATLERDTCADAGGFFDFTGVLSYDTNTQKLFLDTDGVTDDDHVGTLSGTHFVLLGEADRGFECGPVHVKETIEGDLYTVVSDDGGCGAVPDAGTADDGGSEPSVDVHNFQPLLACGQILDGAEPLDAGAPAGSDGGCFSCEIVYQLAGTRQ